MTTEQTGAAVEPTIGGARRHRRRPSRRDPPGAVAARAPAR